MFLNNWYVVSIIVNGMSNDYLNNSNNREWPLKINYNNYKILVIFYNFIN